MMRARTREEDESVDIVLRSGIMTDDDKGKQPEEDGWAHKAPEKEVGFDLTSMKEAFMEARKALLENPPQEVRTRCKTLARLQRLIPL